MQHALPYHMGHVEMESAPPDQEWERLAAGALGLEIKASTL